MATLTLDVLAQADPAVAASIGRERRRQVEGIELIASENYVSEAVLDGRWHCPHQQVRRRTTRQAVLRWLRVR